VVTPAARRKVAGELIEAHGLNVSRSCSLTGLSRSGWYQGPPLEKRPGYDRVIEALNQALERNGRWGFWKCYGWIRLQGLTMNHKRVHRVYVDLGLNQVRRTKRRPPARVKRPLEVPALPNVSWSMDFMSDCLYGGRRFRVLNVMDEGVRECLGIEVDTSLPSARVIRMLEQIKEDRGLPARIRVDNGPEYLAESLQQWCCEHRVQLHHIQRGAPTQNAYIERFNGSFRYEILDAMLFETLDEVREEAWRWQLIYNEERPHDALGRIPPSMFKRQITGEISTFKVSA